MNGQTDGTDDLPGSNWRFLYLIIAILIFILVTPFFEGYVGLRLISDLSLSVIFIIAIFAVSSQKIFVFLAVVLALPMLLSVWTRYFLDSNVVFISGRISGILFFLLAIVNFAKFILRAREVKKEIIFAAIAIYLILAIMWSFNYSLLDHLQPGSFDIPESQIRESGNIFLYFSFVTITTLGYGDITPLSDQAIALATLEAIIGQIYLVVVVAWLVGMHVSRKSR